MAARPIRVRDLSRHLTLSIVRRLIAILYLEAARARNERCVHSCRKWKSVFAAIYRRNNTREEDRSRETRGLSRYKASPMLRNPRADMFIIRSEGSGYLMSRLPVRILKGPLWVEGEESTR